MSKKRLTFKESKIPDRHKEMKEAIRYARKILIVEPTDKLTLEEANSLFNIPKKSPPDIVFILTTKIKRKDREEWQTLAGETGEQKARKVQKKLKELVDLYSGFWARWKKLERLAPRAVYKEWWEKNKDELIQKALPRLELKVKEWKGKKCKVCNKLFIPKRSDQVYCSPRCRDTGAKRRYRQRKKESSIG